ncbi:hypothetical protein IFR04_004056 [Cadophora malorum]|uniref:Uncharacterized protein n=1 Tax=Cadophora malorum TaxID=108018 RepID=A0A8H7WDG9_9HELO|nr:hypothetical protein IFR04_004056 [Cadophora malorum]
MASSPSLLNLLKNDAAIIGSPVLSSSPVSEIVSPRPVRRVSFDALIRLTAAFEPATTTTTSTVASALAAKKRVFDRNRSLLSGSTPEYGGGSWSGKFGAVGGERKGLGGKGVGVIGGERMLRK